MRFLLSSVLFRNYPLESCATHLRMSINLNFGFLSSESEEVLDDSERIKPKIEVINKIRHCYDENTFHKACAHGESAASLNRKDIFCGDLSF
jgi:hypothetical protein